jgi:hypothetical protein
VPLPCAGLLPLTCMHLLYAVKGLKRRS